MSGISGFDLKNAEKSPLVFGLSYVIGELNNLSGLLDPVCEKPLKESLNRIKRKITKEDPDNDPNAILTAINDLRVKIDGVRGPRYELMKTKMGPSFICKDPIPDFLENPKFPQRMVKILLEHTNRALIALEKSINKQQRLMNSKL